MKLRAMVAIVLVASSLSLATPVVADEPSPGGTARPTDRQPTARPTPAATGQPNIVLITTDDQSVAEMRHMPLTRRLLGDAGVTFTRAVSPHPLCCPARAEILTGEFAHNNGTRHNDGPLGGYEQFVTADGGRNARSNLGVWLRRAGYTTGVTGKLMNGYDAGRHGALPGWDWWDPTTVGTYAYYGTGFHNDGRGVERYPDTYVADAVRDRSKAFIRSSARRAAPYFLWVSHIGPHVSAGPYPDRYFDDGAKWHPPVPAERHRGLFARALPPSLRKPSFNEVDLGDKPGRYRHTKPVRRAAVVQKWRERLRALQAVDEANAALVGAVRRTGELDETLFIFTSDNGYLFGEHRLQEKNYVYEENLRVPLLMRGPGVGEGVRSPALATTVDLAPTILEAAGALAGVRRSGRTDGVSLLGDHRNVTAAVSDTTLIQAGTADPKALRTFGWDFRGVHTRRYTYAVHHTGEVELYDRRADPHELDNLVRPRTGELRDPGYAGVLDALRRRYRSLRDCQGARECERSFPPIPEPSTR